MAKIPVVFKYGTRAQYDALATKDEHALYFLTDTGEIYRGAVNLARGSHFEGELTADDADDMAVIARVLNGQPAVQDDIFVVKSLIADGKYSYTSYIYDENGNWKAMDGNYSAKNVYFHNDLTATAPIGVVTIPETGSATIKAEGKSLQDVLVSILAEELQPEATAPTVSVTSSTRGSYEVGSVITPKWSATLNPGSYTYGPETGIVATSWTITDNASTPHTSSEASGSFADVTAEDGKSYVINATATYDAGAEPVTNMGNPAEEGIQIPEGAATGKVTVVSSYRNSFYGVYTAKEVDGVQTGSTSDSIRTLSKSGKTLANGATFNISIPADAVRVVIAYPATLKDLEYVKDSNDSDANIVSAFTNEDGAAKATIKVAGANGYNPIDYKVFSTDFAGAYGATNTFKVKIKA